MKKYVKRLLMLSGVMPSEFKYYDEDVVESEFKWISQNLLVNPLYHDIFIDYYEHECSAREMMEKYSYLMDNGNFTNIIADIDRSLRRHNINYDIACSKKDKFGIRTLFVPTALLRDLSKHFENTIELFEYMKATYCFSVYGFVPKNLDHFMITNVHKDTSHTRNIKDHTWFKAYNANKEKLTKRMCHLFPELKDYTECPRGVKVINKICGAESMCSYYGKMPKPFKLDNTIPEELVKLFLSDVPLQFREILETRYFGEPVSKRQKGLSKEILQRYAECGKLHIRKNDNVRTMINTLIYSEDVYPMNVIRSALGYVDPVPVDREKVGYFMDLLDAKGHKTEAQKIYAIHKYPALRYELLKILKT